MSKQSIVEVVGQTLYAKPIGVESNDSMVGLIDPQDIADRIKERILNGQRIKVYEITRDELEGFIEGRVRGGLKINTYLGSPGEKEIVSAVLGIKSGDLTVKRALDRVIQMRLIALKLLKTPSRQEGGKRRSKGKTLPKEERRMVFRYAS